MATLQKRDMAARGAAAKAQVALVPSAEGPTTEMIAARAYEIWQASGCQAGQEAENWYQAERELRAKMAK